MDESVRLLVERIRTQLGSVLNEAVSPLWWSKSVMLTSGKREASQLSGRAGRAIGPISRADFGRFGRAVARKLRTNGTTRDQNFPRSNGAPNV